MPSEPSCCDCDRVARALLARTERRIRNHDIPMLIPMPNIEILAPRDYADLEVMMDYAINHAKGPIAIRYPRCSEKKLIGLNNVPSVDSQLLVEGDEVAIISVGSMTATAYDALRMLKETGISCSLVDLKRIKPLDEAVILRGLGKTRCMLRRIRTTLRSFFADRNNPAYQRHLYQNAFRFRSARRARNRNEKRGPSDSEVKRGIDIGSYQRSITERAKFRLLKHRLY